MATLSTAIRMVLGLPRYSLFRNRTLATLEGVAAGALIGFGFGGIYHQFRNLYRRASIRVFGGRIFASPDAAARWRASQTSARREAVKHYRRLLRRNIAVATTRRTGDLNRIVRIKAPFTSPNTMIFLAQFPRTSFVTYRTRHSRGGRRSGQYAFIVNQSRKVRRHTGGLGFIGAAQRQMPRFWVHNFHRFYIQFGGQSE